MGGAVVFEAEESLIDLSGKNYSTLWIFSGVFLGAAAFLMTRVRIKAGEPAPRPGTPESLSETP